MNVQNNSSTVQLSAYLKQVRNRAPSSEAPPQQNSAGAAAGFDKVELSDRGREVQQAAQALKTMPETRPEKVARVKMEVETGTYKVTGARLAPDMLRESFENELVLQQIDTRV